ncbi:MAG: hypothetical protein E7119_01995 [Bacteroidales bacterium]|nr:hypothetical protein [Bacteroidales bacterium]
MLDILISNQEIISEEVDNIINLISMDKTEFLYEKPSVEVIEIVVEKGFAQSPVSDFYEDIQDGGFKEW